jgi:hypothetical protein
MNKRIGSKILLLLVFFSCVGIKNNVLGKGGGFTFARGDYQRQYNIKVPWESKGLSAVNMKFTKFGDFEIIKNGKPNCEIVIPSNSEYGDYYNAVAKLLKEFLDASCSGEFKIVKGDASGMGIYIGPCGNNVVLTRYREISRMGDESFGVFSFEKGIMLMGRDAANPLEPKHVPNIFDVNSVRGSYFAIVDFLERMMGFRFYFPGKLGTHIPYYDNESVALPSIAYTDKPVYVLRKSSHGYYQNVDATLLKANKTQRLRWERLLKSGDVELQKFGHTDGFWHQKYAKEHPEWFALRKDGSRMIGDRAGHSAQRCYTNEAAFKEHVRLIERAYDGDESVKPFLRSMPNDKYIYWWENDGFKGCCCEKCEPFMDMKAPLNQMFSRLHWQYILKLAKVIKEKWPGKILKVPLYHNYAFIPKDVTVPDNVTLCTVRYGEGVFSFAYLKEKKYWDLAMEHVDMLNKRSKEKIWIWQHYPLAPRMGTHLQIPYLVPHYLQKFLLLNKDKILGFYLNGAENISYALDGIVIYLQYRLMWNPDLDVDAVIEEYTNVLWGPAGKNVAKYYKLAIDRWENTKWKELPNPPDLNQKIKFTAYWNETYPVEIRERLEKYLDDAVGDTEEKTIYNSRAKYMVAAVKPFFEQGRLFNEVERMRCESIRMTPIIDGKLDEWKNITPLILKKNDNAKRAEFKTLAYVAHDKENLYIAGVAYDKEKLFTPDGKLKRDSPLWRYDSFEIFLCCAKEGDKEAGLRLTDHFYQIIIDPNGNIFDGYKKPGKFKFDSSVNIDIELKTKKTPNGFCFEMAIPFKELAPETHEPGTEWFFNIYRNRNRKNHRGSYAWAPTLGPFNLVDRFGVLAFPYQPLWDKSFNSPNDKFRIERKSTNVKMEESYENGKYLLHVKSGKNLPRKEILLVLLDIPNRVSQTNMVAEMKFRFDGKGLEQLRAYGVDRKERRVLENYIYKPKGDSSSRGWITPVLRRTKSKKTIQSITYFCIAIIPKSEADFTLEIDYIKAYAKP